MSTEKVEYKVVGKGILNAFWFGLIVFIIALIINHVNPHSHYGGWSTLSRGLSMVFIIFGAGVYCFFCFIIAINEWLDNRKKSHVNTEKAMIATFLHGTVALFVGGLYVDYLLSVAFPFYSKNYAKATHCVAFFYLGEVVVSQNTSSNDISIII
ncbi:hypothetical protein [Providencia vermicola]|uniref:hypothetical protein n=1 Tax=Providencia vermicola TaxID=333965 RepID=UPI0034D65F83